MSAEHICERCGNDFARSDSLARHRRRKYRCGGDGVEECDTALRHRERWRKPNYKDSTVVEKVLWNSNDDENNPTFDGAEFCGDKPLTRQTLNKMLKMLRVPEHRWNKIVDKELLERNTVRRFMEDF